jgi:hypothetical protein
MIILKESKQDDVSLALNSFIQACKNSDKEYSLSELNEMVELQALYEAGGFISWIKRKIFGLDNNVLEDIKAEIRTIKTSKDRDAMVNFINELINDAEAIVKMGNAKTAFKLAIQIIGVSTFSKSFSKTFTLLSFIDGITSITPSHIVQPDELRAAIEGSIDVFTMLFRGIKLVGNVFTIISVIQLISTIINYINAKNGTIQDYLDVLNQLKLELTSLHLTI